MESKAIPEIDLGTLAIESWSRMANQNRMVSSRPWSRTQVVFDAGGVGVVRTIRRARFAYIRSDNGPEFCAEAVKRWLKRLGVDILFIVPGSP